MIYWLQESLVLGFEHPKLISAAERLARGHIERQVHDPALRAQAHPRLHARLQARRWSPATITRRSTGPTSTLVTAGIAEIREHGRSSPGTAARSRRTRSSSAPGSTSWTPCPAMHIVGRDGLKLADAWRDGMTAHLGTTVAGFPNLFLLVGPNTGLGHNSIIFMIEAQVRYIMSCLRLVARSQGARDRGQAAGPAALQRLGAGEVQRLGLAEGRLRQLVSRRRRGQPRALAGLHGELLAAHAPGQGRGLPARRGRWHDRPGRRAHGRDPLPGRRSHDRADRPGADRRAADRGVAQALLRPGRGRGLGCAAGCGPALRAAGGWSRCTRRRCGTGSPTTQRDRADQAGDREPGIVRHLVGAAAHADPRPALLPEPVRQQPRRLRADRARRRVPALRHVRPDGADLRAADPSAAGARVPPAQGARRDPRPDADVRRGARDRGVHRLRSSASPSPTSGSSRWSAR